MDEKNKNQTAPPESVPGAERDEREFFERQYFSGDALKEPGDEEIILKTFGETGKKNKAGHKDTGLRKRLYALGAIFTAAAILLGVYFIVLNPSTDPGEDLSKYYQLSQGCIDALIQVNEKIEIAFRDREEAISKDPYGHYVYSFAITFAYEFPNIKVSYGEGGDYCVIRGESGSFAYGEDDFFNKLENGTRFSFNGEVIFGEAVISLAGRQDLGGEGVFLKWALKGYDLDGDTLSNNNRPFLYPNITRGNVDYLVITNEYGSYKAYRMHGDDGSYSTDFYFEGAEFCQYDKEKFASLIVNCTYMLALGKVPNPHGLADYGLESESEAAAVIEVYTLDGSYHKILLGDSLPYGGGYYAKYYNKDFVYILDSSYSGDVLGPVTKLLTANLGYVIPSVNETYSINEVFLKYEDEGKDIFITQRQDLVLSPNIKPYYDTQETNSLLNDKTRLKTAYSNWTENKKTFAGIKSSDGKEMIIQFNLTNYAYNTGVYSVRFGLVSDSANSAVLPVSIKIKAYDPKEESEDTGGVLDDYTEVAYANAFSQPDSSYKLYELSFNFEKQLKAIRIYITAPEGGYVVFDEITIYADYKDAIPNEAVGGIWKMLSPESYIQPGTNYAMPDPSTFAETLYGITTLVGDEVIEYNIFDGDEEEYEATLAKYGLDNPKRVIYYKYQNYKSYVYFSPLYQGESLGDKWYYAFANVSYTDDNGDVYNISPNTIVKVNHSTATYLGWRPEDIIDRSAFTMYIDKIDTIQMDFGGKSYLFELLDTDSNGKMDTVAYDGGFVDTQNFRYVYVSVLECKRAGVYIPADGEISEDKLIFRFAMHSELKDTDISFYRVSSTKVIYQINGMYSEFYVLYSDVSTIMSNVEKLISGKSVPK